MFADLAPALAHQAGRTTPMTTDEKMQSDECVGAIEMHLLPGAQRKPEGGRLIQIIVGKGLNN